MEGNLGKDTAMMMAWKVAYAKTQQVGSHIMNLTFLPYKCEPCPHPPRTHTPLTTMHTHSLPPPFTHTQAHKHTHRHRHTHKHRHTCIHTGTHTHTHTRLRTDDEGGKNKTPTHVRTNPYEHTDNTHMQADTPTHTHIHTHTNVHTHTHTRTHQTALRYCCGWQKWGKLPPLKSWTETLEVHTSSSTYARSLSCTCACRVRVHEVYACINSTCACRVCACPACPTPTRIKQQIRHSMDNLYRKDLRASYICHNAMYVAC